VGEHELWLARRAGGGDETAFATLIETSSARIHGLVSSFVNTDIRLEREDAYQLAVTEAWKSTRRGRFNPNRGDFFAFVSVAARHRLITFAEYLRAERRWTGTPAESIEALDDGVHSVVLGSWITYIDPLRVVLARDELRRCMALTTELERRAIADYLARGGEHIPAHTQHAVCRARRRVRPMLADRYGHGPAPPAEWPASRSRALRLM